MRGQRFLRWVLFFYLGLTLITAVIGFTPLANRMAQTLYMSPQMTPSDCLVVLGGGLLPEGDLSTSSLERTVACAKFYRQGLAQKIILSTGVTNKKPPFLSEASMMKKTLVELGIPEQVIILEEKSRRTAENAREVAQLMKQLGLKEALLVTNSSHMHRSVKSFEKYGIAVHPAPVSSFLEKSRSLEARIALFRAICREYVGLFYYQLRGWI